jgi:hypothetical protein
MEFGLEDDGSSNRLRDAIMAPSGGAQYTFRNQ